MASEQATLAFVPGRKVGGRHPKIATLRVANHEVVVRQALDMCFRKHGNLVFLKYTHADVRDLAMACASHTLAYEFMGSEVKSYGDGKMTMRYPAWPEGVASTLRFVHVNEPGTARTVDLDSALAATRVSPPQSAASSENVEMPDAMIKPSTDDDEQLARARHVIDRVSALHCEAQALFVEIVKEQAEQFVFNASSGNPAENYSESFSAVLARGLYIDCGYVCRLLRGERCDDQRPFKCSRHGPDCVVCKPGLHPVYELTPKPGVQFITRERWSVLRDLLDIMRDKSNGYRCPLWSQVVNQ